MTAETPTRSAEIAILVAEIKEICARNQWNEVTSMANVLADKSRLTQIGGELKVLAGQGDQTEAANLRFHLNSITAGKVHAAIGEELTSVQLALAPGQEEAADPQASSMTHS